MSNTNNYNENFQDFSKCNYNHHFGFSIFYRYLLIANQLNKLEDGAMVLELGAGNSTLEEYMVNNFNKELKFNKFDIKPEENSVKYLDISENMEHFTSRVFDAVVLSEVIEHINPIKAKYVLKNINRILKHSGKFLITTPTPNKEIEELAWPESHDNEFSYNKIKELVNRFFIIEDEISWNIAKRDFNKVIKEEEIPKEIFVKLKGLMPDSFIRALVPFFIENKKDGRQIFMTCEKRNFIK